VTSKQRLIVVSNRLPIVIERDGDAWGISPGSGGLVTALAPVLAQRRGVWIGWPGTGEEAETKLRKLIERQDAELPYSLQPVFLSADETVNFYKGFANEVLWPLCHDLIGSCNFVPEYWQSYQSANRKFAEAAQQSATADDYIWVQDYHLMLVGSYLRESGFKGPLGFFLHIPFPAPDIFMRLPWREQILRALLQYDVIGFQTPRDRRNFLACVRVLLHEPSARHHGQMFVLSLDGREVMVGDFAIGIDFEEFSQEAATAEIGDRAHSIRSDVLPCRIVLGVDRLDYTKGIPERIRVFGRALERFPELVRQVTLVQVVVPSREDIPNYHELKNQIERLVSEINGRYTEPGWVPIQYIYRSLERSELLAYYRASDVALITPLKDGMNLVCKEFCAAKVDLSGALILSEFAGAVNQMRAGALIVNPNDLDGVAEAIRQAIYLDDGERRERMRKLRHVVQQQDIFAWCDAFLNPQAERKSVAKVIPWPEQEEPVKKRSRRKGAPQSFA
jgi:trehalose 6-phosphate synthase/phosphatase